MSASDLRAMIERLGVTQSEFSRLVDVSVGAVAQWLAEVRSIPGPVESYVSLLMRLPSSIREAEIAQMRTGATSMKNGMYLIHFTGSEGSGHATLTFKNGLIYGYDEAGAEYDGSYGMMDSIGNMDVNINVKIKADMPTVAGGVTKPFDWILTVSTKINGYNPIGNVVVQTNLGVPVMAKYTRMRDLPVAA